MYCGILTTENLLLNRRRDKRKVLMRQHEDYQLNIISTYELQSKEQQVEGHDPEQPMTSDVPRIYACATMWHENRVEMVQLLKSLHRYVVRWVVGSILRGVVRELSRDGPVIEVAAQVRGAMGRRIDPSQCGARIK